MRKMIDLAVVFLLAGLLSTPEAMAQSRYRTPANVVDASQPRDCTVKKGPGGLIRGDQIPSGCVIHENGAQPVDAYDRREVYQVIRSQDGVLLPGSSIYHTPGPVNIILSDGTLAGITTAGSPQFGGQLGKLPRRGADVQPSRRFGPIKRSFGSRSRNFGREPGSGLSGQD